MRYETVLVRYGDLILKGKNRNLFINRVFQAIKNKLADLECTYSKLHDRVYVNLLRDNQDEVIKRLGQIPGLYSFSLIVRANPTIEDLALKAIELINSEIDKDVSFKVDTKRTNKAFPMTSIEISQKVAGIVLKQCPQLRVDVHNPEVVLHLELGNEGTVFLGEVMGLGGFPNGIAGKGLLMLSGGIDSPVAGFLAIKQGVEVECIHFESTPLTSIESAQKTIDLCKKLAAYTLHSSIKIHMVPFREMHEGLLKNVPDDYNITIMRRMMYRIASKLAAREKIKILINGESIGQVASQTLGSMFVVNAVSDRPVIRPLATYDKTDIIKIARKIDTFNLSIKPFEDCCTIYVPKNPTTNPNMAKCIAIESSFDYESIVDETLKGIKTINVDANSELDITLFGLEVRNVL